MQVRRPPLELSLPGLLILLVMAALWWQSKPTVAPTEPDPLADFRPPAMQSIQLNLSKKALWRLRTKREKALREGVLRTGDNDWVNGVLREGRRNWPVKLRLKGDWTDHLKGGKWSFRVQMRGDTAYRGMSVFSLQNPETRNFLSEWLFHRVLRQEGVLSPRYDIVRLALNGSNLGVYALEEHFTKELMESQHRREGILLKFNEDGLWEARVEALHDPRFPYLDLPLYEAAQPEAFQTTRYLSSDSARRRLNAALGLMHAYKHGLRPAGEIFDLDLVARQYALTDLFHGHHSLVWHNRRFAYNPVLCKLEPVVYDAFAGEISGMYLNGPFTGYAANGATSYGRREDLLGTCFFRDDRFVEAYYGYLRTYSNPSYLVELKAAYEAEWKKRERFLRQEFLDYEFDFHAIERNAGEIRKALNSLKKEQVEIHWEEIPYLCVQNYSPLAIQIRASAKDGDREVDEWVILGAYDGVGPAEWVEFYWKSNEIWEYKVVGQPNSAVFTYSPPRPC